jgi:aspartate beta-hydroxylase
MIEQLQALYGELRNKHPQADFSRLDDNLAAFMRGEKRTSPLPRQRPIYWYKGLRDKPWHDRDEFAAIPMLERAYPEIRAELGKLLTARNRFEPFRGDPEQKNNYIIGDMDVFYFKDAFSKDQAYIQHNRKMAPVTTAILDSLPRLGETAFFSILEPGTHLKPHCGAENLRTFVHLGMIIPDGCAIRVVDRQVSWQEGKCIVFDDSFEHEAWNRGTATRVILLIEFWHPDLNPAEIEFFQHLSPLLRENPRLL